jgi:UDP-N-acetylmuramate--alanine ligase
MHIYFSGIGAGTGPLALMAHKAGYKVSGSDKQDNDYVGYLAKQGIKTIHIGQTVENIAFVHTKEPIDWLVYSSAVTKENPDHPELLFALNKGIKTSKRDEFINKILEDSKQVMIAIAGTHGKTTTTAMTIWLFKQLGVPISYSVGAKLSFGDMSEFNKDAHYFIYEADEYDRNFLSFKPEISIIPGIGYDHPDVYPTKEDYYQAFDEFISQSQDVYAHKIDMEKIGHKSNDINVSESDFTLPGLVNRQNAQLVVQALHDTSNVPLVRLIDLMNSFPGVSRRFERIRDGIYSDYAHTPEKIRGALQMAREVAGDNVVVVYEGLHNNRQHFIKKELPTLFEGVKKLYIVPSYLAREDKTLELLTPEKLCELISQPQFCEPAQLNDKLRESITAHARNNDLVLSLTAGGGGSLDEWLRKVFI